MNKIFLVAAGVVLVGSAFAQTAFTAGRLVVATTFKTNPSPSSESGEVRLVEFSLTPSAPSTYQYALPSTSGTQNFTGRWDSTSGLNLQFDGTNFFLAGWNAVAGTPFIQSTAATSVARTVAVVPIAGTPAYYNFNAFNINDIRSAYKVGNNIYMVGSGNNSTGTAVSGVRMGTTAGGSTINITPASGQSFNNRVVSVYNGDLYYGTGSATGPTTIGILKYSGIPTASVLATSIIADPGTSPSPYDFVFTNANTCYFADDRSIANGGGVYKFTFNGSVWSQAALFTVGTLGARSITYLGGNDFAVVTPEVNSVNSLTGATTILSPTQIWKLTDTVVPITTLLQTAPDGQLFRGIRYIPASNQALTGSLNLANTGAFAFNRSIGYSVTQGTSTIGSGTITASASATSFNISLSASYTGAATIVWDGSSFLKRKTNINLTGSNLAVGSVTMQNGDVDNSGEVDAADIDAVIANFGSMSDITSDVDVSGEVDAADIDIVIANFGGTDD